MEIKLNSTPYHQGTLLVAWIPGWTSTTAPDLRTLSGCHPIILSASNQDSATITLPYWGPADWFDNTGALVANDTRIARLFIKPMNAITATSANIPLTVPLTIFASFTNIQVGGFTSHGDLEWEAHSQTSKEAHAKASGGIDVKTAVSVGSKLLRKAPVVGPAYGAIADVINSISGDLSKPLSEEAYHPMVSTISKSSALTHGLTYADQLTMYPDAKLTQSKLFCGMETSHMTVSEMAQRPMIYRIDTLDNITTSFTFPVSPLSQGNLPAGANGITFDWLAFTAYTFRRWRGGIKYRFHICVPPFYSFRMRISLIDQGGYPVVNTGELMSKVIDVKGDTWEDIVIPYFRTETWSNPRREVQGGAFTNIPVIKVELLTTVVGSVAPTTPKVYINTWRAGAEDTAFYSLMGARDGNDPPVPDKGFEAHCSIDEAFKKPFQGLVSGTTQSSERGFVVPEVAVTVADCLKRPSSHYWVLTNNPVRVTYPGSWNPGTGNINNTLVGREPFHYFASVFQFWRGSRILKNYPEPNMCRITFQGQGTRENSSEGDGMARWWTNANDDYSTGGIHRAYQCISVPYASCVPWYPILYSGRSIDPNYLQGAFNQYDPVDLQGITWVDTTENYFRTSVEAGDDFMLLNPLPFFAQVFSPYPSLEKTGPPDLTQSRKFDVYTSTKEPIHRP